jgi:hypothetical protein
LYAVSVFRCDPIQFGLCMRKASAEAFGRHHLKKTRMF